MGYNVSMEKISSEYARSLKSGHFDNGVMLAPDGEILCRSSIKRLQWYVKRNLADLVVENPYTIKLKFEPKARQRLGGYSSDGIKNYCVVCRKEEGLSRHHIIPYCYTRHMSDKDKQHAGYNIVLLCREHHDIYETIAFEKKSVLAKEYGYPCKRIDDDVDLRVRKHAATICYKSEKIPEHNINLIRKKIADFFEVELDKVTVDFCKDVANGKILPVQPYINHAEFIVSKLDTEEKMNDFKIMWRKHFIETLNPKYLPNYWDLELGYK